MSPRRRRIDIGVAATQASKRAKGVSGLWRDRVQTVIAAGETCGGKREGCYLVISGATAMRITYSPYALLSRWNESSRSVTRQTDSYFPLLHMSFFY